MLLLIIVTLLIVYLIHSAGKNLSYWKNKGVKYVKPLPLFGNVLPLLLKKLTIHELIIKLYNDFPNERYFGIWQFTTPIFVIKDPELIKSVAIKNFDNFVDHQGFASEKVDPLWGKNLFASEGERWRDLRQTLSPCFTSSKMRTMFVFMDECVKQLVSYLKEQNRSIVEVELKDMCTRYTNDVIATTAFGIKCDSLKNRENEFLLAGRELTDFTGLNSLKFLLYGQIPTIARIFNLKIVSDRVGNFFKSIITETIKVREEKNIVRPDLIHLLMLARKGKLKFEDYTNIPEAGFAAVKESEVGTTSRDSQFLSDEDITAQALVFFFGGFDTSSQLMCFAGYELAANQDIQKRLQEEIKEVVRKTEGKTTYEHLLGMKYLDMVISETLRKWPQATFLDRKCTKEFVIEPEKDDESKVKIDVGTYCWIAVAGIHRDPNYYPNPDQFDPERFSDENKDKILPGTYLPFGTGPRNCIGSRFALLEIKILLFHLLQHFDIVPTAKTQIPLVLDKNSFSLSSENGFNVGLKRIE